MNRAYAVLELKAVDDDQRTIEGIATTPTPDRAGDILEPAGARFALPMPLLWQHDQTQPIGEVLDARVTAAGIVIKARLAKIDDAGRLKDRVDEAWQSIKAGLVRGLSVGWNPIEVLPIKGSFGKRAVKWLWAELSAVTVPMNVEATILAVKSSAQPARKDRPVMTIAEQISAFENTRAATSARMSVLMTEAAGAQRTLDADEATEYEGLATKMDDVDKHLVRLHVLEKTNAAAAVPVQPTVETKALTPSVITIKPNVPPGIALVRAVCAKVMCNGNMHEAAEYAKRWDDSTPEVSLYLKAAIAPGTATDATWAGPLVNQNIAKDFIELLRPATILGQIPGLRMVPFNTKVPSQTAGGTYGWVGEAKPKPLTKLAFSSVSLTWSKVAGIIVITEELARLSSPNAEMLVRNDMIAGIAQFLDQQFIDPAVAAVAGVNPASITNGAPTAAATASPLADIMGLISHFATNNIAVGGVTFIMSAANALSLSFRTNTDGSPLFPGIGMNGGTYRGLTFVTSQTAGTNVIALQPALILCADDGGVTIDVSREASLQMDSAPASPADATTVYVSLWQTNAVGLRAERYITWAKANANAVKYLTAAAYPAPAGANGEPVAAAKK
jgi:HK97 family phage major capsid protein/HK97 family phage prohead protease